MNNTEDSDEDDERLNDSEEQQSQAHMEDNDEDCQLPMFRQFQKLFQFRSSLQTNKANHRQVQNHLVTKGQYEFPFTLTIPRGNPSSFQFIDSNGNNYQVKYVV